MDDQRPYHDEILALFDMVTTVCTVVAVTAGLTFTIYLLAVYRKPLPALPISITFGILFYFVSSITLGPFISSYVVRPDRIITDSGLWVGQDGGAGFIYT
jgi:presenilin 1